MDVFKDPSPHDFDIFAGWEKQTRPYPWTSDQFQEAQVSHAAQVLVWKGKGDPKGFVVMGVIGEEAYIQNIMVAPQHQGKGWGQKLLEMAECWCVEHQISSLQLEVDPQNRRAYELYLRLGFEIIGSRKNAYPRGEHAVVMVKRINKTK